MKHMAKPKKPQTTHSRSGTKAQPRDTGDPAIARIETIKWLNGLGPEPAHKVMLFPDDQGAWDRYRDARARQQGPEFDLSVEDARRILLTSSQHRLGQRLDQRQAQTRTGLLRARKATDTRMTTLAEHILGRVRRILLELPKTRHSTRQIAMQLCNPKGLKRDESNVGKWTYPWTYRGKIRPISFGTLYRRVAEAQKILSS